MFFCAKYGLNEKEYFFSANCQSAVLWDFVQERTLKDTRTALAERRDIEKKERARAFRQFQQQKRLLEGCLADQQALKARSMPEDDLLPVLEMRQKVVEALEDEYKQREDAWAKLQQFEEELAKVKKVELAEGTPPNLTPVALKPPEKNKGGDVASTFIAPRATVYVLAFSDGDPSPDGAEVPMKSWPLSFALQEIKAAEVPEA
jgi:hypothetical protein